MPKTLAELSDDHLRSIIIHDVRMLERADLDAEQRKMAEQRYAICISETVRRFRDRMQQKPRACDA